MIIYSDLGASLLILCLGIGLVALFFGGDWLCRGASSLALKLNISPIIVGLTIVAVATSMPELLTSFYAAIKGSPGLAMGNIVGSNLVNISLIIGIAALVRPIEIQLRLLRKELPILMVVTGVYWYMAYDGFMGHFEGFILLGGMVAYILFLLWEVRQEGKKAEKVLAIEGVKEAKGHSWFWCILFIFLGAAALHLGAELLVKSAVEIAGRMGVSDTIIGLTIVAIGTSLPELSASIMAAIRGQSDLCAGNIIGSNLFNMLMVGGGVAAISPIVVDPQLVQIDFPAMILLTAVIWLTFVTGRILSRFEGGLLILVYGLVMGLSCSLKLGWL